MDLGTVIQFSLFIHDVWPPETLACRSKLIGARPVRVLLRTLAVVGKQQQSESIKVAIDMEEGGLMNRF